MEAVSEGYCRCCKKLFNREGKKHSVNLFGEKAMKEGIERAVRKYGNIDLKTQDIGVLSTSICHSCYLLVKGIVEKIIKFASICQGNSLQENENGQKRTVAERSPSQIAPVNLPKRVRHPDSEDGPCRPSAKNVFKISSNMSEACRPREHAGKQNYKMQNISLIFSK